MRLAVISDEVAPGLEDALELCTRLEVSAVELRTVDGVNVTLLGDAEVIQLASALRGGGFVCPAVASPFLKDPPRAEVAWEALTRALEVARLLGAGVVRIFSGVRTTAAPDPGWLVRTLARALDIAEGTGVRVALELEHECHVATREEAGELLAMLADARLGLVWDPGNEAKFLGAPPRPFALGAVADAIAHVHVKDADTEGAWVTAGAGLVDWDAELRHLAARGYDGYLSIETHHALPDGGAPAATEAAVQALRGVAARAGVALA